MINEKSELVKSIDILSTDDSKLKVFAEVISNKSSLEILNLLFKNEMTANEISQKTNVSLQLVKYHLEKMQRIDLVCVSRVGKNSKARDMNYYKASKFAVVITPAEVTEKAKQSKLLSRSFKSIYRFFGLAAASVASVLSIIITNAESNLFRQIESWYESFQLPIRISRSGLPDSIDESYYLAKTKVDSVVANPGGGSGTPYFDAYSPVMGFTGSDFVLTMLIIAAMGTALSLPFFIMSYRHQKKLDAKYQ